MVLKEHSLQQEEWKIAFYKVAMRQHARIQKVLSGDGGPTLDSVALVF